MKRETSSLRHIQTVNDLKPLIIPPPPPLLRRRRPQRFDKAWQVLPPSYYMYQYEAEKLSTIAEPCQIYLRVGCAFVLEVGGACARIRRSPARARAGTSTR